jgi:hypothetical protein
MITLEEMHRRYVRTVLAAVTGSRRMQRRCWSSIGGAVSTLAPGRTRTAG